MNKKTDKKNIVEIGLLGLPPIPYDRGEEWKNLLAMPIDQQRENILTDLHFLIHLGAMNLPQEITSRFMRYFTAPEAVEARSVAMQGLTAANYEREFDLLFTACDYAQKSKRGELRGKRQSNMATMTIISLRFVEIVSNRNTAALRRIINIIENNGEIPTGERGGIGSEDRFMLEKFCDLHLASRSLPSKAQVKKACHITDEKTASKRMKKLGLWGLPTAPELKRLSL